MQLIICIYLNLGDVAWYIEQTKAANEKLEPENVLACLLEKEPKQQKKMIKLNVSVHRLISL